MALRCAADQLRRRAIGWKGVHCVAGVRRYCAVGETRTRGSVCLEYVQRATGGGGESCAQTRVRGCRLDKEGVCVPSLLERASTAVGRGEERVGGGRGGGGGGGGGGGSSGPCAWNGKTGSCARICHSSMYLTPECQLLSRVVVGGGGGGGRGGGGGGYDGNVKDWHGRSRSLGGGRLGSNFRPVGSGCRQVWLSSSSMISWLSRGGIANGAYSWHAHVAPILTGPREIHSEAGGDASETRNASDASAKYGRVLSFGDGSQGALGHAEEELLNSFEPEEVRGLPLNIASVGAGHYHSFAITGQGELWAWGRNAEGQLGIASEGGTSPPQQTTAVEKGGTAGDAPLTGPGPAEAGAAGAAAATSSGQEEKAEGKVEGKAEETLSQQVEEVAWDWSVPHRVKGLEDVKVVGAVGSGVVSMAIGSDGSLWSWGSSRRGQLGLGEGVVHVGTPTRVQALEGHHVTQVSCGWGHALACTAKGEVFAWGVATDGRLGFHIPEKGDDHGSTEKVPSSITKTVVGEKAEKSVEGEDGISAQVVTEAEVMRQVEKQVREEMEKEERMPLVWKPERVKALEGRHVVAVACGMDHSLALTKEGEVLSFGDNSLKQLGRRLTPSKSRGEGVGEMGTVEGLEGYVGLGIAAGLGHSMALAKEIDAGGSGRSHEGGGGGGGGREGEDGGQSGKREASAARVHSRHVFAWGWNGGAQLGVPRAATMGTEGKEGQEAAGDGERAQEVEALRTEDVTMVRCGRVHSVAVGRDGRLWSWGSGATGRLGIGSTNEEPEPVWVEKVNGQVLGVACGFDHTVVLVSS